MLCCVLRECVRERIVVFRRVVFVVWYYWDCQKKHYRKKEQKKMMKLSAYVIELPDNAYKVGIEGIYGNCDG